jgi:DNA modification methylase
MYYKLYPHLEPYQSKFASLEFQNISDSSKKFIQRAAYYAEINLSPTFHSLFSSITGPNQKDRQNNYFTHCFYLYYGKSEPQLIRAIINSVCLKDHALILDPFCGSGTILLEAELMGLNGIGFDVNPISCLVSNVKTQIFKKNLPTIKSKYTKWFHFSNFLKKANRNYPFYHDVIYQFYLMTYISGLSDERYLKIGAQDAYNKNYKRFIGILEQYELILPQLNGFEYGNCWILNDTAINLNKYIPNESIDLIITSPPYLDVLDYVNNDLHALRCLGIDIQQLKSNMLGDKSKTNNIYWSELTQIMINLYRVIKPNHYCILIVGSVKNMHERCIEIGKSSGFIYEKMETVPRTAKNSRIYNEYILYFLK